MFNLKTRNLVQCCSLLIAASLLPASAETARDKLTFILATTPGSSERLRTIDGQVDQERPGYYGELFFAAGDACDLSIEFKQAPWNRVLHQVKHRKVDAAFRASYNEERGTYAAYPRTESGELDVDRALTSYTYSLFMNAGADLAWDGTSATGEDRRIAVETSSIGVDLAKKLELQPVEVRDYDKMIDLLKSGRVDGALVMTRNFQKTLNDAEVSTAQVSVASPTVAKKSSYLMFSQITYDEYPNQVECFWTKSAEIMSTQEYNAWVRSYQSEE